ncbi:MAG: transketolase C-terminal domain-containing protein [Chitinophagaceae bacterium]
MMKVALGAAEELQKENISAEVIDLANYPPYGLANHFGVS